MCKSSVKYSRDSEELIPPEEIKKLFESEPAKVYSKDKQALDKMKMESLNNMIEEIQFT